MIVINFRLTIKFGTEAALFSKGGGKPVPRIADADAVCLTRSR